MHLRDHRFADAGFTAIVAHRGGAKQWPENTVDALEGALGIGPVGVDAVEVDVHPSSDGVVVVVHDARLHRTTPAAGLVVEHTAQQLQEIVPHDAQHGIATLTTWAERLHAESVALSLELKVDVDNQPYPGLEAACVDVLRATRTADAAMVHSFSFAQLKTLRALDDNLFLGANVEQDTEDAAGSFAALVDEVKALGAGNLNADFRMMTEAKLQAAHDAGLTVTLWTVDDDDDLIRWMQAGVDVIATDRPTRALELRVELQASAPR